MPARLPAPPGRCIFASVKPALLILLATVLALLSGIPAHARETEETPPPAAKSSAKQDVVVIPVRDQIDKPILYILRRGLKEAISNEVDTVILDMETPGGSLAVTFEILKALEKFPGKTVTYVNSEAISAGALISAATDEIWFSPAPSSAPPPPSSPPEVKSTRR